MEHVSIDFIAVRASIRAWIVGRWHPHAIKQHLCSSSAVISCLMPALELARRLCIVVECVVRRFVFDDDHATFDFAKLVWLVATTVYVRTQAIFSKCLESYFK